MKTSFSQIIRFLFPIFRKKDSPMKNISVSQLKEWKKENKNFQLVDVREVNEFRQGHIDGADHIAMSQVSAQMNRFKKNQPIVVYCLSGMRSFQVGSYIAQQLREQEIYNLDGGISAWAASN